MSDDEAKSSEGSEAEGSEAEGSEAEGSGAEGSGAEGSGAEGSEAESADAGDSEATEASASKQRARAEKPARSKSAGKTKAASSGDSEGEAGSEAPRRDLPKWNRARVKRKAPAGQEQDAFQASVRKAGRGILQRPWAVLGLIVAVAGAGAGVYAWRQSVESSRAEATAVLATAAAYEARGEVVENYDAQFGNRVRPLPQPVTKSEAERRQTVDEALADLEQQAPKSPANIVADLVRAARLARARDYEAAEKAYRGFLEREPDHPLAFLARDGLIITLEAQERWDDALAEVEPMLGAEGDYLRDEALWHKGRLLEEAGRTDEAIEVYKQYVQEYPLDKVSHAQQQVRDRLSELDPASVPAAPDRPMIPGMPGGIGP